MAKRLKKYWFIAGLATVFFLVMIDAGGTLTSMGKWFKTHHGTDLVMFVIFLGSGLMLDIRKLKAGASDLTGHLAALVLIFICAPALAFLLGRTHLSPGIVIGFLSFRRPPPP